MIDIRQNPLAFQGASELGDWLAAHHLSATELCVRIFKASADTQSIIWNDCVVESIRFGLIDGQKQPLDADSFLQRLTPRKSKSNWSAKNCAHATALIAEGRMAPAGLAQVEAAKADGRWDKASAGSATMTIPQDFLDTLDSAPKAKAFFLTLDRKNLYSIYYRFTLRKSRRREPGVSRRYLHSWSAVIRFIDCALNCTRGVSC